MRARSSSSPYTSDTSTTSCILDRLVCIGTIRIDRTRVRGSAKETSSTFERRPCAISLMRSGKVNLLPQAVLSILHDNEASDTTSLHSTILVTFATQRDKTRLEETGRARQPEHPWALKKKRQSSGRHAGQKSRGGVRARSRDSSRSSIFVSSGGGGVLARSSLPLRRSGVGLRLRGSRSGLLLRGRLLSSRSWTRSSRSRSWGRSRSRSLSRS